MRRSEGGVVFEMQLRQLRELLQTRHISQLIVSEIQLP